MASNGEEAKKWERPWTIEEVRQNVSNWSLAGDAGLLLHIQDFSQKMLGRVHETNGHIDDLIHDTKVSSVKLENAFNDFVMLANTQFVENRVFDDDVTQEPEPEKPEQEKSREDREAELIGRVKSAIQLGLTVVDDMFEVVHVDIGEDSDSEDEAEGEAILKVKNPYQDRPLPHLIGTQAFMEDDSIGMKEESSSEEESEEEEEESEEDIKKDEESDSDFSDESFQEKKEIIPKTKSQKRISSSESDGDLFGASDKDEDSDEEEDQQPRQSITKPQAVFASELARKIRAAPPEVSGGNEDDYEEQPKTVKSTKATKPTHESKVKKSKEKVVEKPADEDSDDLFGPPEDDGQTSWRSDGLFSGGGGLFDDEPGGLFDDVTDSPPVSKDKVTKPVDTKKDSSVSQKSKKPAGGVSIFGGGDDDLFGESPPEVSAPIKAPPSAPSLQTSVAKNTPSAVDLFADEESDDDLFASKPKQKTKPKAEASSGGGLFADEDDLFAEPKSVKTSVADKKRPSLPAGAVSMFGGGVNPVTLGIANRRPKSDDESDDNRSTSSSRTSLRQTKAERSPSVSSNSLFADEPEELPSNPQPAKQSVAAIFDDDEDNDLFSTTSKPSSETRKSKSAALFIEDDDDIFAQPKEAKKEKKEVKPLFSPDEGDLFAGAQPEINVTNNSSKKDPVKATSAISLFDDGDEEDFGTDLFAPKSTPTLSSKKTEKENTTTKPRKSLFADDDLLFGQADDDPNVDLFGPSSPLKEPSKPFVKSTKTLEVGKMVVDVKEAAESDSKSVLNGRKEESLPSDAFSDSKTDIEPAKLSFAGGKPVSFLPLPLDGATETESDDVGFDHVDTKKTSPIRKPVGGVSLFGGVDVLGIKKRDSLMKEDTEVLTTQQSQNPVQNHVTDNVNNDVITFDQQPTVDVLTSLNKDRAKLGAKRRPPTRKGRQPQPEIESIGTSTETDPVIPTKTSQLENRQDSPEIHPAPRPTLLEIAKNSAVVNNNENSEYAKDIPRESRDHSNDLADSPDDLFTGVAQKKTVDVFRSLEDENDIFNSKPRKSEKMLEEEEDIFGDASKLAKKSSAIFDESPSDIFNSPKLKPPPNDNDIFSTPSAKISTKSMGNAASDSDDDIFKADSKKVVILDDNDIFATPTASVVPSSTKTETNNYDDIFNDDTDIFSDIPKKSKKKKSVDDGSLFKDDVDDIFASPSASKSSRTASATKKAKTKKKTKQSGQQAAAAIFDENSPNIFDDPLSALQS